MALIQSLWATRQRNTPNAGCAAAVVAQLFEYTLTAAALAANDIIELGVLPANNEVCDMVLVPDDLDTNGAPTMSLDVGLMSGEVGALLNADNSARTVGAEFFAADTGVRTGAISRPTLKTAFTTAAADKDRSIGVKIVAAAATQAAAGTKLRLMVFYRAV